MAKKNLTPEEKNVIVQGFADSSLKVQDYCKYKKISISQFYNWQKALRSGHSPRRKLRAPEGKYDAAVKVQNQILKEMLAQAYQENALIKKAA